MAALLFRFRFYDVIRRRWVTARYRATFEQISTNGRPFQLLDHGWRPSEVGGGTAAHLQSSPKPT
jgi:hypothetical protein